MIQLHVNVDHVATLRQVRQATRPDPVQAAAWCEAAGADGITVHLREDRRHIQLRDVEGLRQSVRGRLNVECAPDAATLRLVLAQRPDLITLVPERRQELTTEGGLDVCSMPATLQAALVQCRDAQVPVSLFVDADLTQIEAAVQLEVHGLELHTGPYAHAATTPPQGAAATSQSLAALVAAAERIQRKAPALRLAAGHGLSRDNLPALVAALPQLAEVNIGHALVADALAFGLGETVHLYRRILAGAQPTP
ncbi:MAG: pyridoxine 5'-phosphate synthase [Polyangiales bacterium]